jgi:hypothetical protein
MRGATSAWFGNAQYNVRDVMKLDHVAGGPIPPRI